MKWEGCVQERIAREGTHKNAKILLKQSKDTFQTAKTIPLTKHKKRSKLLLLYDAVRESLESLSVEHGYEIHNHECYRAFLRDVLKKEELSKLFNQSRILRNKMEYDGYQIPINKAKEETNNLKKQYFALQDLH